jgi:8-oxo-dGTP diphosphatase
MITVVVAAAVVERDGRFLLTRRRAGTHLAGMWEFPGGKCEAAESLPACLVRELQEELAVEATIHDEVLATTFDYSDRRVELHFFRCSITPEPSAVLGQEIRWVAGDELERVDLPPADASLIRLLADRAAR